MVKKCRNCNQSITANNASFCPTCGEPIPGDNLLLGKYRLIRTLGKGGFGQVYLSEDTQIYDRKCAIKRTNMKEKGFSQEFVEKEAKVLVGLNNAGIPGVPDIYDAFIQDDSFYVVMRFIEGQDLSQRREQANLGWQEIIDWFIQVLDILTHLHNLPMPVIHTDIKPANIIHDEFGKIWLVDFGIAQSKSLSDVPFTANGASVFKDDRTQILSDKAWATLQIPDQDYSPGGSLDYSPWEQWQYRPTAASDVYAAALSLYYLLYWLREVQSA